MVHCRPSQPETVYSGSSNTDHVDYSSLSPDLRDLFLEVDEALEAYQKSIDEGLRLSRFILSATADMDQEMENVTAELQEWFC